MNFFYFDPSNTQTLVLLFNYLQYVRIHSNKISYLEIMLRIMFLFLCYFRVNKIDFEEVTIDLSKGQQKSHEYASKPKTFHYFFNL